LTLSYGEAIAALTERGRFGISMGLERVERLMAEAGRPDVGLGGALVGGTNGKGSVVAMVRSVLGAAGLRVGTMPKPISSATVSGSRWTVSRSTRPTSRPL